MLSKQQTSQLKAGFTIIEVVLVLAIAGLIFLMVFVALPALQRSQRDTQRRNDMSRVSTSLTQYQTNHQNSSTTLPEGLSYWAACEDGSFNSASYQGSCITEENTGHSFKAKEAMEFVRGYMNPGTDEGNTNTFRDPDGAFYSIYITENFGKGDISRSKAPALLKGNATNGYSIGSEFDSHIIYVIPGGKCDGEKVVKDTTRHFAVMYRLEGAGVYCIDDQ